MDLINMSELLQEAMECAGELDIKGAAEFLRLIRIEDNVTPLLDIVMTEAVFKHWEACMRDSEKSRRKTNVYFIRSNASGLVKIGKTTKPIEKRLSQISTVCAGGIELLASLNDVDVSLENDLHIKFKRLRVHGEWFLYEKDLIEYVCSIKN